MEEKLLDILERICDDEAVREDLEMDLFEEGLLDSLAIAELIVAVEEEFKVVCARARVCTHTYTRKHRN